MNDIENAIREWAINYRSTPQWGKQSTPLEVGQALKEIRDRHLYREAFDDFYVYCARRWGKRPQEIDRLIAIDEGQNTSMTNQDNVKPEEKREQFVYFIAGGGSIKIGLATNIESRVATIQSMSPVKLSLLGYIEGNMKTERELHKQFSQFRIHGEWFIDCAAIRNFILKEYPRRF